MKHKLIKSATILTLLIWMTTLSCIDIFAQEVSDPEAVSVLNKLKQKYNSYESLKLNFELIIKLAEQDEEIQKGIFEQSGNKYHVKLPEQEVYCDGKSLWLYLVGENEVQINDYDPDESTGIMSPKELLKMYDSGDYVYAIVEKKKIGGKNTTVIDFKPLDKDSEYFKIRLTLLDRLNQVERIKIFANDGSRFTLNIQSQHPNVPLSDSIFVFNEQLYPNVRVEDLRLD